MVPFNQSVFGNNHLHKHAFQRQRVHSIDEFATMEGGGPERV